MEIESGSRLALFIERYVKMKHVALAPLVNRTKMDISKYVTGRVSTPDDVLKIMHQKWGYNLNWHHTGEGPMKISGYNEKRLANDIQDILASVAATEARVNGMDQKLQRMVTDFYEFRNEVKGTQKGHISSQN